TCLPWPGDTSCTVATFVSVIFLLRGDFSARPRGNSYTAWAPFAKTAGAGRGGRPATLFLTSFYRTTWAGQGVPGRHWHGPCLRRGDPIEPEAAVGADGESGAALPSGPCGIPVRTRPGKVAGGVPRPPDPRQSRAVANRRPRGASPAKLPPQ